MKPGSKTFLLLGLTLFLATGTRAGARGLTAPDPFAPVPAGDPAYGQLLQLEDTGWLPKGAVKSPLTRLEVAGLVWKAGQKHKEIVLAQADMDLPPSLPDENEASSDGEAPPSAPPDDWSGNTSTTGTGSTAPASKAPKPLLAPDYAAHPEKLQEAERNLRSLEAAYELELEVVLQAKRSLMEKVAKAEEDQYSLWKSLKSFTQASNVAIHGVGRMNGVSRQYYGDYSNLAFSQPALRNIAGFLDLETAASVSKEVRWSSILRIAANNVPATGTQSISQFSPPNLRDGIFFRRMELDFNPDFMSATLGDFYEAYTPLTLWNRNRLDLYYKPEPLARKDEEARYESLFDQAPSWPFRGLRLGTALGWPDSDIVDMFKVSVFAHMISNGFSDAGGLYRGPYDFTDWIFAGSSELRSKKWYLGGLSCQVSVKAYGIILDEPLDTNTPGATYDPNNPNPFPPAGGEPWAHQYRIGSIAPSVTFGLGDDLYLGGQYEGAFAAFQNDKNNPARTVSDYAVLFGPFFKMGDSQITFRYLDVGPYYYSPLAQSREDSMSGASSAGEPATPGLFEPVLRNQFFLTGVPKAGDIYGFYDRTQDNVFPYGLATPNRLGGGVEIDIRALEKKALRIAGAAYLLQEISSNLVMNLAGTGYVTVDPAPLSGLEPKRNFTYVNFGPSFDLGPVVGLTTPLEIGCDVRYEQTTSDLGTLTSTWLLGGVRAGVLPGWELTGTFSQQNTTGSEAGYNGTLLARYPYLYSNADLGKYSTFTVDGNVQSLKFSSVLQVTKNSTLYLDYDLTRGNIHPYVQTIVGTLENQYMEMTYEIKF